MEKIFNNSFYATPVFSPIHRACREAALSRAIYRADKTERETKGRFNVLVIGLSRKNKDVKTPCEFRPSAGTTR